MQHENACKGTFILQYMGLLQNQSITAIRSVLLVSVFAVFGTGILLGKGGPESLTDPVSQDTVSRKVYSEDGIYRYSSQTLSPVYTGQTVSFTIQSEAPERFAVKTNILYLATLTPNLAFEAAVGRKFSLEIGGGFHPWKKEVTVTPDGEDQSDITVDGKRLKHWLVKPEFRYWLDRPFFGHFFGVSALYGQYDVGGYDVPWLFDKEFFYDGDAYGGSVVYGYHWAFSRRWRAEFNVGAGVLQMKYDKKECENDYCDAESKSYKKTYFGPTQVGVKLVFMIK